MNRQAWVAGGRTVAFAGERIFYRVDGDDDRPTILFAHGYPTSSHDYAPILAKLTPRYRCVTFDFLGFGASSKPRRKYSYALQHDVLAKVVETTKIKRAVLVVHDYAVTVGQHFLAGTPRAPFDLAGVLFLNGGLDPAQHRARLLQRLLTTRVGALVGPHLLRRDSALRALRAVFVRKAALPDDDAWDSVASDGGLRVMPALLHYLAERRAERDTLLAALRTTTIPRAFVWGLGDPVSGAHVLAALRSSLGDARIHRLEGVGHYPQLEAPDEVAAIIDETAGAWLAMPPTRP